MPFTVEALAVVGVPSFMSPMYSPPSAGSLPPLGPLMAKSTDIPSTTGFPFISVTINLIRDVSTWPDPLNPITEGVAESNAIAPVAGATTVILTVSLTTSAVPVIVIIPGIVLAVNVPVAIPAAVVAISDIVPEDAVNVTEVPSGTFAPTMSRTVAEMLDVPLTVTAGGVAVSVIVAAEADTVMSTSALTLPAVPVIVTVPAVTEAVNVTVAIPLAVVAAPSIVPEDAVNVTGVPSGTFAPLLLRTVAEMLDVSVIAIAEGVAARVTAAGTVGLAVLVGDVANVPPPPTFEDKPLPSPHE